MNDNMRCKNVEYLVWTGRKNFDTVLAPSALEAVRLFSNRYNFQNNQKIFAVPLTDMRVFRAHVETLRDIVVDRKNS